MKVEKETFLKSRKQVTKVLTFTGLYFNDYNEDFRDNEKVLFDTHKSYFFVQSGCHLYNFSCSIHTFIGKFLQLNKGMLTEGEGCVQ